MMDAVQQTLQEYVTPDGENPFRDWLGALRASLQHRRSVVVWWRQVNAETRHRHRKELLAGLPAEIVMKKASVNYDLGLKVSLADPAEAAAYLNAALEDGSQDVFLMALRDVADARGLTRLARETSLNRENMYRILSEKGNPQLSSLKALLESLGLKLTVEPRHAVA